MLHVGIKRTRIKIFYVAIAALIIGGAFSTYAQLSNQAYTVSTVHVFPSQIEAVGFENAETLTFQNLDEYALLQDFNTINSATLDADFVTKQPEAAASDDVAEIANDNVVPADEPDSNEVEIIPVGATSTPAETAPSSDDGPVENAESDDGAVPESVEPAQATSTETEVVSESEAPIELEEESVPESEPTEPEAETGTTTVRRHIDTLFALAVETLTETFSTTSGTSTEVESSNGSTENQETDDVVVEVSDEDVTFGFAGTATTAVLSSDILVATPTAATTTATDSEQTSSIQDDEQVSVEVNDTESSETVATTTEIDVVAGDAETGVETSIATTTTPTQRSCEPDCNGHVLRLENFGYPLDEGVELSGAQLRMSFAAKQRATREEIPAFTMNYSLDGGESWSTGGSIALEDEVSNSLNGGYYLFALPTITEPATLQNLRVELRYDNDPALLESLYVESVWLELFVLEPPTDPVETDFAELLLNDGYTDSKLAGDTLLLPNDEKINFTFTDDNDGETLIVKSDKKTYEGLSEAVTYFSVTNTSNETDQFSVQTYFPNERGEVTGLEVFNLNKPRTAVIPEYRPYMYHCAAGWETDIAVQSPASDTIESLSIATVSSTTADTEFIASSTASSTIELAPEPTIETQATSSIDIDVAVATSTDDIGSLSYSCRETSVVRTCDQIEGEGTACVVSEKVKDHQVTKYAPGWDKVATQAGKMKGAGVIERVSSFFGLRPKRKDIPDTFTGNVHTNETFSIAPGETRYFKMDIAFPPFSNGEYWIEVVGDNEYGLLDPFWSSQWQYRMPLQIDNPVGTDQTEFQVKLQLDSALSDFWSNVDSAGDDIRFVQEITTGNLFDEVGPQYDNAYDNAWADRLAITIDASNVDSLLTDFPVYVNLADLGPDFWAGVQSDGDDIRITEADGATELPYDLVEIDTVAETGELHFLASRVDSGTNTTFHIYFNNPSAAGYAAGDTYGRNAVWANYEAVYHFEEDPNVGITDKTGNGFDLTTTVGTAATSSGQLGTALDTTSSNVLLEDADWTWATGSSLYSSGLYFMSGGADTGSLWQWSSQCGGDNCMAFMPQYNGTTQGYHRFGETSGNNYTYTPNNAIWHHFTTFGRAASGELVQIYEDNVLLDTYTQSVSGANPSLVGLQIGRYNTGAYMDIDVDELRFSTVEPSTSWVAAEHLNFATSTDFYATSTQLAGGLPSIGWYDTSWNQRVPFDIAPNAVNGTQTDFPVYLDLSILGSEFFAGVATDGRDIRITTDDGKTELPVEVVTIDTGAETGELYFKATISGGEQFYVYFDNEDASAPARDATYGSENVWTNGFQAVYHLQEDQSGIGNPNVYLDSTANEYHGDDENASDGKTGLFGAGQEFGDTQADRLSLPKEVLNGLTTLSTSWWHQTTNTGQQTIVSASKDNTGAGANEYIVWFNSDTNFQVYLENGAESFGLSDTITDHTGGAWNYFMSTADAGSVGSEVNFYVNGQADTENPDPQAFTDIEVANGGLVVGQEQDSLGAGFSSTQNFEGNLDELRFASAVRDGGWVDTEYENMSDNTGFFSTSSTEVLQVTEFVELDYWLYDWDYGGQSADIWLQVEDLPAAGATVYMYYGNASAPAASSELDTFSYDTLTEVYYVVDDHGADSVEVTSLIDNNQVQLDGGTVFDLNRGETASISSPNGTDALAILGPVSAAVNGAGGDNSEILVPVSFATTTFALPSNRDINQAYMYPLFGSTTVRSYIGASATADQTFNIATTSISIATADPAETTPGGDGDGIILEASGPILVMNRTSEGTDGYVSYPPTTDDIFGVYSRDTLLGGINASTDVDIACSDGTTGSQTGITRGDAENNVTCSNGDSNDQEGAGDGVRIHNADGPVTALQQADADGTETTTYWPDKEFGTLYAVPQATAYIAVVCSPTFGSVGIEVQDELGNVLETGNCTPGASTPGKAYFTNGTGSGDSSNFGAGSMVVATNSVPFYMIWEDVTDDQDEKNAIGSLQARKYGAGDAVYSAGAQELANGPVYEQLSFAWYQNESALTPTTTWSLGSGEFVSEGDAISGGGAVDSGDVLRLRMNVAVSSATATAEMDAFILQYAPGTSGQCSAVTDWSNLGEVGSSTAAFAGYNNAGVSDGTTLATTTLASSTVSATYEERNFSNLLPNDVAPGGAAEWDWVITAENITINQNYCFRMIRVTGEEFETYTLYPELETVGPPNTPIPIAFFDNEHTPLLAPVLEFVATDIAGDEIHYEVQVDDDITFSSIDLEEDSQSNFLPFAEADGGADKAPFSSGETIRFTATTDLASSTTYWWRVRASDPFGSATSSDWSTPFSFTTNQTITVSEWLQTTADQFGTNDLVSVSTSSGQANMVGSAGTMTGTAVDFDDATVGNAWGEVAWNSTETAATTSVQVQYNDNGTWKFVPDADLPGNAAGHTVSPVSILELDTSTYNEIRLVANFTGTTASLQDWTVRWGQRVDIPTQGDLFDNQKTGSNVPVFDFFSSDPQGDDLEYEISFSTDFTFESSSSTFNSVTDPGFLSGGGTYPSGDTVTYTTQSALSDNTTYWWRTRAKDPLGGDAWSPWATPDAFTVASGTTLSTWFQTTRDQFNQGELDGTTASTSGSVVVSEDIGEYGRITLTNNAWTTINTTLNYKDMVVVGSPEFNFNGSSNGRTVRVRNKGENSFEIKVDNYLDSFTGSTEVDYIVMEAGDWTIDDGGAGFRILAATEEGVTEKQSDTYNNATGENITISPAFSGAPIALATVSSDNDSSWVGSHLDGGGAFANSVTTSNIRLALTISRHTTSVHTGGEDIDYLVIEPGNGTVDGTNFHAFDTGDAITDVESSDTLTGFTVEPAVTVVHVNGDDGAQGGFAQKDLGTAGNNTTIYTSISEQGSSADGHTTTNVSVFAFEDASGLIKRDITTGGTVSTIAGEDIIFSDGAGPKFANFTWSSTSPGASSVTMQLQYRVSEGVYALIPDGALPGNSTGFTSSPIDLTSIDINTYDQIRPFATLNCSGGVCPSVDDWQLEWSEGVNMSGTLQEYDRTTAVATGSISASVNGGTAITGGTVTGGVWTLNNVTAFAGDIVTVWVDGVAADDERAVTAFVYDGIGDITGVALYENHLAFDADEFGGSISNAQLGLYDNANDSDIMFAVDLSNNLNMCAAGVCDTANIYVGPGQTYIPATTTTVSVDTHDFINDGSIELDGNTFNVSGSWDNNATSSTDTSTINLTAATGTESITSTESPLDFHTVTFGGFGNATFTIDVPLDLSGDLTVATGTLVRDGFDIAVAGSIATDYGGVWSGTGTTTFDGSGAKTWSDGNATPQNVGNVIIDGPSTIVTITSDVSAYDVTIGTNDTLVGGSGNTIYVGGDWTNTGVFTADTSTVEITTDDRTYPPIIPGSADWYADTNFDKRVAIVVDSGEVPGPLSNFPLYVDLSTYGDDFWNDVASDGRDIRITNADGMTELPHDLVEFDAVAKTGELHLLADSVSSTADTMFYLYFDNNSAVAYDSDDPYGSEAVWAEYVAVYHFNQDPTFVGASMVDETGNGYTLQVEGAALATSSGQLGTALDFNSSVGLLRDSDFTWPSGDRLTTSGWYFMTAASNESFWHWGTGAQPDNIEFRPWYSGTNGLHYFGVTGGATYSINPRDTTNWHHFVTLGATSTSEDNVVYEDSIEVERVTQTVASPSNTDVNGLQVGRDGGGGSINAVFDEFRIATVTRNTDWVEAEYTNQFSPTIFYSTTTAQTYNQPVVIDEATHVITAGGSAFNVLRLNDATTSPSFADASVVVNDDFIVATGTTVALPTGVLTIGGSLLNSGFVMHNNGEIEFTSSGVETIQLQGTEFLNYLYDVTFDGSGTWTFTDVNATSSGFVDIEDGTVVFPSGVLTIGDSLVVQGGGANFDNNSGTVRFTSAESENITTAGSAFNNVVFGDGAFGWYDENWTDRIEITIDAAIPQATLTDYPMYIDLNGLGATFWSNVASDGRDVRVTTADGETEIAHDLVSIDGTGQTGELHFLAPLISDISSTTYYIYIGNPAATAYESDAQYGRENVWVNYEAVYHFHEDPTGGATDVSGNGKDLTVAVGTPGTTTGQLGQALDTTSSNVMLADSDWTWTAGENLISSGLYFQSAVDTGALWQFGTSCVADTCLAFLPWYNSGDRGYHRVGEITGSDYRFPRDNSVWHHFTTLGGVTDGDRVEIYEDTIVRDSYAQTATGEDPSQTGLQIGRYTTGTYMDIDVDELRFATSAPSTAWIDYEFNNLTSAQTHYSVASGQFLDNVTSFTLNESVTTAEGDVTLEGARLIAPSDTFFIGGSALNTTGVYDPNNATTTFNSTDLGETFDFGDVSFYNLAFDGVGGGWTVSTTTVENNLTLANGASYVQATNTTMTVGGIFSNQFASLATDWTQSTLVLTGGDYVVTDRLGSGDTYATLQVSNDTDIVIWNSFISTSSVQDTSSIYMPDFSGVDGQLNVYGQYERTAGDEHWSYATDFDGTDLTGGSERQANVFFEGGTSVTMATGTTLNIVGIDGATSTIQSLFGIYELELQAATLNASRFSMVDAAPTGLELRNASIVSSLAQADFAVAPGRTAITVDDDTVNAQPSSAFSTVNFATSSATTIYKNDWTEQLLLSIHATSVEQSLTDFPVYVDLASLGADFWAGVQSDGADIRVTTDLGRELPIDMVEIDTGAETGEIHFLAPTLSSVEDTEFYIHYNNPSATAYADNDQYGANAVWTGYEAVYHFNEDPAAGITDKSGNGRDLVTAIGVAATTSGQVGTALDTTAGNVVLTDNDWEWLSGDDLISSGLYFQTAIDTGALWQFSSTCGGDNCLAFLPWYDNGGAGNRGYHRFGETSGNDYSFVRDNTSWHHFTTIGRAGLGESNLIYEDNVLRDTYAQSASGVNPSQTGLQIGRYQTGTYMDIQIDELRFSTTVPSESERKAEYYNLANVAGFYATSTGPTETFNVTTDGVPVTFWSFSNGTGNIYGETFDNDDGDPGSIQWDDSDFTITISGTVYQDDGVTPQSAPVCNGSTEVVTVVLDGGATFTAPCDPNDGRYEITGITYSGEPKIVAYIESGAPTGQVNAGVAGQTTGTGTTAGGVIPVSRPTVQTGDVLVAIIGKDDDPALGAPAGWVALDTLGNTTGDDMHTGAWYRVVTDAGTEPASYNFTSADNGEGYSWWVGALVNVDNVTPVDVASTWTKYQADFTPAAQSVTSVTNGAIAIASWYAYRDTDLTLTDTSWATQVEDLATPEGDSLSVQSKLIATAGATGDVYANNVETGRESQAAQFVFRPAASVPATSSIVAAAVTKTPIGAGATAYKTISIRDQRAAASSTPAGGTISVLAPNMVNDDVLVAIIGKDDDLSVSAPAGWIKGADLGSLTGSQVYSSIWYKIITNAAGEPASYSFTNNDSSIEEVMYWVGSFENVDTANVFDVTPAWSNVQNSSAPAAPSVTTVTDGAYVLAAWTVMFDNTITMPGGSWDTLAEDLNISSRALNVAGQRFTTAGATGAVTITNASTDDVNVGQFALRPAPASVAEGITDLDLYQNRVIVRHEDIAALSIADMNTFDSAQDSDVPFTVSTSTSPDSLSVSAGSGLYVFNNKTFAPDGTVTLTGTGNTSVDGSLTLGPAATYTSTGTNAISIGGSLFVEAGATFTGAQSLLSFTATGSGQQIGSAASSTINLYDVEFTGAGGGWAVQTPIVVDQDVFVQTGTLSGVGDVRVTTGDFYGNGTVAMTGGTVQLDIDNTLGGTTPWTFYNLTLGDGVTSGTTIPATTATTTVSNQLRINSGHFLDAFGSTWDLAGNGSVFVESGSFLEGTSTVRYSGATPTILRTAYNNLVVDTESGGNVTAVAPTTGLQILGDLTVGALGTSTLDLTTNDPLTAAGGDVYIGTLGTIEASDSNAFDVFGSWDNDGTFTANGGLVEFLLSTGTASIAAGNSSFADLTIAGNADYTMTESATSTGDLQLGTGVFTLQSGETLSVGGVFTNGMDDGDTSWTGTTLRLYGSQAYTVNSKVTGDTYNVIEVSSSTHPRFWNTDATTITTEAGSSLYSMDHAGVVGDLYIFGDLVSTGFDDYWSYTEDWDGAALGVPRIANVQIEDAGSVLYTGGSLTVLGSSTASTTIAAQGSGPFNLILGGTTTINMNYYSVREVDSAGLTLTGSPAVTDLSYGDFEPATGGASGMTVGGTVINVNQAQNFTNNRFATTSAISGVNVTATGTAVSSWRFVNVDGNLDGEQYDVDPGGDPGYIVWQDSAAIIDISGTVYQNDRATVSTVCDGATNNVRLSIGGLTFASTTCDGGTGAYTFTGVGFGPSDTLLVYIDGEAVEAANVTKDPISLINNMDLYENHVIVRHESTGPMTIAAMSVYDSSDDADIPFTAVDAATDTLTVPSDFALVVWDDKTFAPQGNMTLSGGGAGASYDGTLELFTDAVFDAGSAEVHSIGGNLVSGVDATFDAETSTTTFTSSAAARTIDTNDSGFHNVAFTGTGSWTITDAEGDVNNNLLITAGAVTLPAATTTVSGSFTNSGGSFVASGGTLVFDATGTGNDVTFGGSDAHEVIFAGSGGVWTFGDTNATTTDSFTVATGTVTLPSGTLTVTEDFVVNDTVAHAGGAVRVIGTSGSNVVTLSGNDLTDLTVEAISGDYTLTDSSATLLGSLTVATGTFTVGAGTVAIGDSFDVSGGVFNHGSGTLLFNSADAGEFIDPGSNDLHNVVIAGAGGWTLADHATTTNNFSLSTAGSFVLTSGSVLYVGGVFTNDVGGAATTWTNTTLVLDGMNEYETGAKSTANEAYATLILGDNTDISSWNSSAATVTVPVSSSWYSQDNAGVDGDLYIYGDYHIGTTTEYWSAATDFDGAAIASRAVSVAIASGSVITLENTGTLNVIGTINTATTTIDNQGSGTYTWQATGGTLNADVYSVTNLGSSGLQLLNDTTVTSLSNGSFTQTANNQTLITLASTTLNANAGLIITDTGFADGGFTGGVNVSLDATTTNSWTFTGALGDLWGEVFDVDGTDDCSSIRWDDSSCLLTEQTDYRWRNDDGGEGAVDSTWYDNSWSKRQRIRVINDDATAYASTAVKFAVPYDADMQSDFDDLRVTASDGVTLVHHWTERVQAGSEATVWLQAPSLPANSVSEFYLYYGNVSATSSSDGDSVMLLIEDFEDDDLTPYGGDTGLFTIDTPFAFGGSLGLDTAGNENSRATDGIMRDDITASSGQRLRYMQYIDTSASGVNDEVCTLFATQDPVTDNENYAVCVEQPGTDRISLVRDVADTEFSGTILASSTATFSSGWYEFNIDWQTDNDIIVTMSDASGVEVATMSANDSTYSTGGIGFTFWFQHGGWDSFVAWPRTDTLPTVHLGEEQEDGGATWANAQNTPTGGFLFGETARLRIGIENTGLDIENQNFQLEFAPKLTAPTCEAVDPADFVEVPNAASCGVSAVCMDTSTNITDGDPTTDHLLTDAGDFVAGEIVTSPSNQTANFDLDQNRYTELEYALNLTVNAANDAYCFRVTDDGDSLDSYSNLPELTLAFDPVLDPVALNDGLDIVLTSGTTTEIIASTTVTDLNGVADLGSATTTFYKTSVGAACTPNDNNCYIATNTCAYSNCSATSCTLQCTAPFEYHTDPTDLDGGEEWFAFVEVSDLGGASDFETSPGVELLTLRAMDVQNAIGYGVVDINENTGTFNPDVELLNIGNESIDVQISGTDMTDGVTSVIPAGQQLFSTSTFDYPACIGCSTLTVTPATIEVDLDKPTTTTPAVMDSVYWGIEVPFGTASNPHTGTNFFTAVAD